MAFTSRAITANEATAASRTVVFGAWVVADGTPKTDLTAATALIHTDGGAGVASTANFAHISDGRYSLVLTQAEVNLTAGTHLLIGPVDAAAYVITPAEVVIVAAAPNVTVTSMDANTVTASVLATDATTEIADALLNRDMATGTDSGNNTTIRTVRQALRGSRNRVAVSAGVATVYKEDDTTVSHTAVITGTPAVTEANPPGGA
jgi:hypothetical protein